MSGKASDGRQLRLVRKPQDRPRMRTAGIAARSYVDSGRRGFRVVTKGSDDEAVTRPDFAVQVGPFRIGCIDKKPSWLTATC